MKLKLVTNGIVHGAKVLDENGQCLGSIDEVVITNRQPLTLVKVGSDGHRPTPEELDSWRKVFEEAQTENTFTIFAPSDVTVETIYPRGNVELNVKLDSK